MNHFDINADDEGEWWGKEMLEKVPPAPYIKS